MESKALGEVAATFLRLGTTAFGGPAAHLALMEAEFVRRREWLTHEEFVDMIGAANLVPGPNSTEVAIHIGLRRAGWIGMVLAGVCFILPAALIASIIAAGYVRYGSLPNFQAALYGIKPVVVAVVAQAIALLIAKVVDTWPKRLALGASLALATVGVAELAILFGAGIVLGGVAVRKTRDWRSAGPLLQLLACVTAVALIPLAWEALRHGPPNPQPATIFLYFLKVGSILYGSGYVLLAFLDRDLITQWHWLGKGQLLDAVAVGQFTPGPVFTTATFIGYVLAGPAGAAAATVGIFLPSFLFVAISGKLLPALRKSPVSAGFLDGVNAAALALMAAVLIRLGLDAIRDFPTAMIALLSLIALLRFRLNSAGLILAGAVLGLIIRR